MMLRREEYETRVESGFPLWEYARAELKHARPSLADEEILVELRHIDDEHEKEILFEAEPSASGLIVRERERVVHEPIIKPQEEECNSTKVLI
jgi:flagellar biosynthesis regulator FlbT